MTSWLFFIFEVFRKQASRALQILDENQTELLLSEKQLAVWRWIHTLADGIFTTRVAVSATGFPVRTVGQIIKKLMTMDRLERLGEGRGTRYRLKR